MYNKLIFRKFESDAHLFEHLVLNRFIAKIKEGNIPIEYVGFFNGETFSDRSAFYGGFYFRRASEVFEEVVNSDLKFTEEESLDAKKIIRAEESGEEKILKFKLMNLNLDEKKVALRLFPVVFDVILEFCRSSFAYLRENTSLVDSGDDLAFAIKISALDDFDFDDFQEKIMQKIQGYPIEENFTYIEKIFKKAIEYNQFYLLPLDFYRFTGIETSNEEIFNLLSLDRISKILKNIKIEN